MSVPLLVNFLELCNHGRVIFDTSQSGRRVRILFSTCILLFLAGGAFGAATGTNAFPIPLGAYPPKSASVWQTLVERVRVEPFNIVATLLFFLAIIHTFLAPVFVRLAHKHEDAVSRASGGAHSVARARFKAEIFHLLGEVEAIFGIWIVPLILAITLQKGWHAARDYIGHGLNFTEPLFVVVIMTIAASRPILNLAEHVMSVLASIGKGSPAAWWLSILSVGPILGSFITEPAAITICALLLARKFYLYRPSARLAYATLGLLFVNISVGGTLTHFAAPPVLMVAGKWGWGFSFMVTHFGWKAVVGILAANSLYLFLFRRELKALKSVEAASEGASDTAIVLQPPVPVWITLVHVFFLGWTVFNNHYPALFIGGFLFYLAFTKATADFQSALALRPALLVGFFLAGLVVHGGLQGWWIAPVLGGLNATPLFYSAVVLTAFNDNAAITYLASLVPNFHSELQYAVVSGAVVGGGLTVIANAPNPAGQSILSRFFENGVSALKLFLWALPPTIIVGACFQLF